MSRLRVTLILVALAMALPVTAHEGSVSTDNEVNSCSDLQFRFGGRAVVRAEESLVMPAGHLDLSSGRNGGIHVSGWDGSGYSVTICKAAAAGEADLGQVRAIRSGSALSVEGPSNNQWVAFLLVKAPKGADLKMETTNGPLTIRQVSGTVLANAKNGPVSIRDSSGRMEASAQNGPISLVGGSGDAVLLAKNGPLSIRLTGSDWSGGELRGESKNGPLSVELSPRFGSGVVVETAGHSPVSCSATGCQAAVVEEGERWPRSVTVGSGPPRVHLATENGPVTIRDRV